MNYNKVIMAGNLTNDPEIRKVGEHTVTNFSIANNRKVKDKEKVCFIDCQAWNKTGDMIADNFRKGDPIFLDGQLQYEKWEKDGVKHGKHVVNVLTFNYVKPRDSKPREKVDGTPF